MKSHLRVVTRLNQALVLVSPDYEIKEVREEVLWQITCLCVCMTGILSEAETITNMHQTYWF